MWKSAKYLEFLGKFSHSSITGRRSHICRVLVSKILLLLLDLVD
jgi:hypothetical protein